MKKLSILLIILLILTQFSINAVSDAGKNTIYVDDGNTSGPWEGTQDNPYQYIQDAIDMAETGDTVFVYDGFYNEQILIDKTLNLQGESMEDTIIDGTGLGRLCTIQETNNVLVSGFTFQNAESDAEALYLPNSSSVVIEQNRFTKNKYTTIYIGGSSHLISENEIVNNTYGINTLRVVSSGNTLANNTIKNNKGNGIYITVKNNKIIGNIIEDNEQTGIAILDYPYLHNTVISNNLIEGNNVGIRVPYLTAYNVITNNTIRGNTKSGIIFDSVRSTISYNMIENNSIGLLQRFDSNLNNISHNTFSSNDVGIQNLQTLSNSYTENNFIENTVHASFLSFIPLYQYHDETLVFNSWDNNYWDNWKIGLPKPIFGLYCLVPYLMPIPYCLFDRNPASDPFDLEA